MFRMERRYGRLMVESECGKNRVIDVGEGIVVGSGS